MSAPDGTLAAETLRSESRRIVGLLAATSGLLVYTVLRAVFWQDEGFDPERRLMPFAVGVIVSFGLYEVGVLALVRRAIASGGRLSPGFWAVNVVVETAIPTVFMLVLSAMRSVDPFEALTAPVVLVYAVFIAFSVLRLRPWLSLLAGALSASGHAVAYAAEVARHPGIGASEHAFEPSVMLSYPMLLLMLGLASAWIAREIRRRVEHQIDEAGALARAQRELDLARSIQSGLLPVPLPGLEGHEIAGFCRPADETGGDYYDWLRTPDGRVLVTLGDVSGHGLGPALVTIASRAYARAFSDRRPLERFLTDVNTLLYDDLSGGRFVTMAALLLDGETAQIVSGGHGPLFVVRAGGGVERVMPTALPVGIDRAFEPGTPVTFTLDDGDSVVLLTDGYFEQPGPGGDRYGLDRLEASLSRHAREAPASMIEAIDREVGGFASGERQQDDMTVVVVWKTGAPG